MSKYMIYLATKIAATLESEAPNALPSDQYSLLYQKLTSILRSGKHPYIRYVGDHSVFDTGNEYIVEILLMPVREDFTGNTDENSPNLSESNFHKLTQSLVAELQAVLPPGKTVITDEQLGDNLTGKRIQFLIPKN